LDSTLDLGCDHAHSKMSRYLGSMPMLIGSNSLSAKSGTRRESDENIGVGFRDEVGGIGLGRLGKRFDQGRKAFVDAARTCNDDGIQFTRVFKP
jgi:hypothetical protein